MNGEQTMKFGEWKIWNGGQNPAPGRNVQVQLAGDTRFFAEDRDISSSEEWSWDCGGYAPLSDIIAYREVIEPVRKTVVWEGCWDVDFEDFYEDPSEASDDFPVRFTFTTDEHGHPVTSEPITAEWIGGGK